MSQDIASLGFAVDSSPVVTARRNLDDMRTSSDGASRSSQLLTLQIADQKVAVQQLSAATQSLNKDFGATETALDALMRRMESSRQTLRGFGADMPDFSKLQQQVEGVAVSFGVTSSALEAYYRQSQQLAFTTPQTVQSISRITEALQNQTAAGQQVRRVLQDYGVNLSGLGSNDATKVLASFTEKLRGYADTAQKFRTAQLVLGPLDTDSFGKLSNPGYTPIESKRLAAKRLEDDSYLADRARNAAIITRQTDRNTAERQDLASQFNLGGFGSIGGLSGAQRMALGKQLGLSNGSGLGTQSDQLAMLRYLSQNPNSPEAASAFDVGSALKRNGGADTASSRWLRFLGSGQYGANALEISAQFGADRQNVGLFGAVGNSLRRETANLFNLYKPQSAIGDDRPTDPFEKFLQDSSRANTLGGFGDYGLQRRVRADEAMRSFATDAQGRPTNDATRDSYKAFEGTYGLVEGGQRFAQIQARFKRAQDTAMVPGQSQLDQGAQEAFLLSLPREQRGMAQRYLDFAARPDVGIDTSGLFQEAKKDRDASGALGRILTPNVMYGAGAMTDSQGRAFRAINEQTDQNQYDSSRDAFQQRIGDQDKLTQAAAKGSAAIEEQTVRTQAYNAAIQAGKKDTLAKLEADQAAYELGQRRLTQSTETLANMEAENKIEADRIARVGATVGGAVERAQETNAAGIDADYQRAKRNDPTLDYAKYLKARQGATANQVTAFGNDTVARDEQNLRQQKDLLSVAGSRADIQAKFVRDQQVELEYAKALGEAGSNPKLIAQVEAQIAKSKELRDALAEVNAVAQAFKLGRDATQSAADTNAITSLPRSQRGLARALQPAVTFGRDNFGLEPGQSGTTNGQYMPGAGTGTDFDTMRDRVARELGIEPEQARRLNLVEGKRNPDGSWKSSDVPGSHATGPFQVQPGTFNEMQQRYGFAGGINDDEANTRAGLLYYREQLQRSGNDPGAAYQKYHDGPGSTRTSTEALRGMGIMSNGARAVGEYAGGLASDYSARNRAEATDLSEQSQIQMRGSNAALALTRSGQTGAAQLARISGSVDEGDPNGALRARLQIAQALAGFQTQFASTQATTDQSIDSNTRLAAAYKQGGAALDELNDKLKVEGEARTLLLSKGQQEERMESLRKDRARSQSRDIEASLKQQRDANALQEGDNSLGPFASDEAISRNRARLQAEQTIRDRYASAPEADQQAVRDQAMANEDIKERTSYVQQERDAWKQVQDASFSTLNQMIVSGGDAKQVLGALGKELSSILLQLAEAPLKKAGTNWLSGLLGGGGGGGVGDTFSGPGAALSLEAAGGAFFGGTRMMAAGGILDRPTKFFSAGGQANMAGEMGNEAILPLRRMPDGNLGVAGGSGGKGSSVVVNAPITVQGGAVGSNGQMDPAAAASLQKQLAEQVRVAVVSTIAQEKRPGGSLY